MDTELNVKRLLNEKQAAARLGVSRMTLFRLRRQKAIGHFRIGARVFYSLDHVSDYLISVERKRSEGIG
jgi:excisionase family DNA binding protein